MKHLLKVDFFIRVFIRNFVVSLTITKKPYIMSKTKEYLEEQYTEVDFADVEYQEYLYRKSLQDMNQRFEEELEELKKEEEPKTK